MASQRMLLALEFIEVYNMQTDPIGINALRDLGIKSYYYVYTHVTLSINTPQWEMTLYVLCIRRVVFCIEVTGSGRPAVRDLLASLEYGPAPESPAVVEAWLEDHGRSLGHFIGNQWVKPEGRKSYSSYNPATGALLATTVQGNPQTYIGNKNTQWMFIKRNTGNCILF